MVHGLAMTRDATTECVLECAEDAPAFNAVEFLGLSDMIGEDGVVEMVEIFEVETRHRLRRLAAGDQTIAAQLREMHTLKGAAGTVGAPRLTALGRTLEQAAGGGVPPVANDFKTIEAALDAYLREARAWIADRGIADRGIADRRATA
jgi:HPt (histidine-containing phosphotransfer) domain-containing protein